MRGLEIGPGMESVKGFETFNLGEQKQSDGKTSDHVGDARKMGMFKDGEFDCVYSSHCIEHVHWYELQSTINEWSRLVKPGGTLEIWTVNGYKVMQQLIMLEEKGEITETLNMNWKKHLTNNDPFLWLQGKLYNYTKNPNLDFDYQLHRSLLTPKSLCKFFEQAGLKNVHSADMSENRLTNRHGWINMGVIGTK